MTIRQLQYRQALNEALHEEMARDPMTCVLGEDIGSYGSPFKITEGLYERLGGKRVRDTPISEAGFCGLAVGAAMTGLRPVAWRNHGPYRFKGVDDPYDVCEVGEDGLAPLAPPPPTAKGWPADRADEELGWRPAAGVAVPGTTLNADVDGDGDVDIFDFNQYAAWYNILDLNADVDGDSDVDIFDFNQYAAWYNAESGGGGTSGYAPVPEPATLLLSLAGLTSLLFRKRLSSHSR